MGVQRMPEEGHASGPQEWPAQRPTGEAEGVHRERLDSAWRQFGTYRECVSPPVAEHGRAVWRG